MCLVAPRAYYIYIKLDYTCIIVVNLTLGKGGYKNTTGEGVMILHANQKVKSNVFTDKNTIITVMK